MRPFVGIILVLLHCDLPRDGMHSIYSYDHRTSDPKHLFIYYEAAETESRLADSSCVLDS
jgi:hypothetical protein